MAETGPECGCGGGTVEEGRAEVEEVEEGGEVARVGMAVVEGEAELGEAPEVDRPVEEEVGRGTPL